MSEHALPKECRPATPENCSESSSSRNSNTNGKSEKTVSPQPTNPTQQTLLPTDQGIWAWVAEDQQNRSQKRVQQKTNNYVPLQRSTRTSPSRGRYQQGKRNGIFNRLGHAFQRSIWRKPITMAKRQQQYLNTRSKWTPTKSNWRPFLQLRWQPKTFRTIRHTFGLRRPFSNRFRR